MQVRQRLWNLFTEIKDHVVTAALAHYGLDSFKDNLKRAHRAGWLLQDDRFLFPNPEVSNPLLWHANYGVQIRRQRFFHPAIISTIGKIFFSRAHGEYGMKYGSDGRRMLDQMALGAIS